MLIPILTLSLFFSSIDTAHAVSALDFAKTAVWYIIKYAANTFYTKQPTISSGYNWVQSSTGSFKFNNTYGASTKVTTKLPDSSMSIDYTNSIMLNSLNKFSKMEEYNYV